jgi:diguanylate cyclase (GGDEF)-like protein
MKQHAAVNVGLPSSEKPRFGISTAYLRHPAFIGLLLSLSGLSLLLAADLTFGLLAPLRYLYLLPLWFGTRLGGRWVGFTLAILSSFILTYLEVSRGKMALPFFMLNFGLRIAILSTFILVVAQVEDSLKTFHRLAKHDPLTGLLNRRALGEFAYHAIERAKRLRRPMTVVLIDCDRFKQVNDRFGHPAGDQVLQTIARVLEQDARASDIVARLGGDEFVVILQNTSRVGAKVYAERIQREFEREVHLLGFDFVSLSSGLAELGVDGRTITQLLDRADREMYTRKALKRSLPSFA